MMTPNTSQIQSQKEGQRRPSVVAHTSNLSIWETDLSEFKVNLVYIASSKTAKAI